eukprot:44645-Amorphochlora_amoeboformis.AAC.1
MFKVKLSVGSKNVTGSIGGVGSTENDENIFMGHQTVDLRAIPEATGLRYVLRGAIESGEMQGERWEGVRER